MNYHLNKNGQDAGIFSLEELRQRRQAGELNGSELVWTLGMAQWQPLDSILQPALPRQPKFILPPPLPPGQQRRETNPVVVLVLAFAVGGFLVFATLFGVGFMQAFRLGTAKRQPAFAPASPGTGSAHLAAMDAASRPVSTNSSTPTWVEARKATREFRFRQFVAGYQLRGDRNPKCDLLALQFLTNWIDTTYGGPVDTNLPSLAELSDRLAGDQACQDPLLLTVTAVNAADTAAANRRFERALTGFENSRHLGYPKFFAVVTLETKLTGSQTNRLAALDAQALNYLKAGLTDGSLQPADQNELGEVLVNGWGRDFFGRNAPEVHSLVDDQGKSFRWLALVLEGENDILEAWRSRGSGLASTVTQHGWTEFFGCLTSARLCLTRAWRLRPDLPLAPCRMITVALGNSDITEMRTWFDRTTKAQLDYANAWVGMRWGLRPRWLGDVNSMLAFGQMALNTRRFDTDVPKVYLDTISDLESESGLPVGDHLYAATNIWSNLNQMFQGYVAEPSLGPDARDAWRSSYAVAAYFEKKYDVARQQLAALNWQPRPAYLDGWARDLSLLPEEVAARTGPLAAQIADAEHWREAGDLAGALMVYQGLATTNMDAMTDSFVRDRLLTLGLEKRLQSGDWVDFLPADTNLTGWHAGLGQFSVLPDGALEVHADEFGHLIYSRVRLGEQFEVRGRFEVVSSTTTNTFQAGLVMGLPQAGFHNWFAFRMKRSDDGGNVASFSQDWGPRQITAPVLLDSHENAFDLRFFQGRITATVNGNKMFKAIHPPAGSYVNTNEFFLGLGAFNDSDSTVIRYRGIQVRRLLAQSH